MQDGASKFSEAGFSAITYELSDQSGSGSSGGGLSIGVMVGIVIAALFVMIAIGVTAAFIL